MGKKCRLCNSNKIKLIKHGVRDNENIDVFKCSNCGLEFLSQTVQADEKFYAEGKMHSFYGLDNWLEQTKVDDIRRTEYLKNIIKNKDVLDFGTGNGGFLIHAGKYTNSICGCDLDKSLEEHYKNQNLNVKYSLDELDKKFDVITMFHVLEHLENPQLILNDLKNYLKPDGKFIIEIPNSEDALLTLYKSEAFKNFTYWSCHLFAYNDKNIKLLLNKILKINKIKYIQRYPYTNHKGWLKDKKAGGHKIYNKNNLLDKIYTGILKLTRRTDTLIIIASC